MGRTHSGRSNDLGEDSRIENSNGIAPGLRIRVQYFGVVFSRAGNRASKISRVLTHRKFQRYCSRTYRDTCIIRNRRPPRTAEGP